MLYIGDIVLYNNNIYPYNLRTFLKNIKYLTITKKIMYISIGNNIKYIRLEINDKRSYTKENKKWN